MALVSITDAAKLSRKNRSTIYRDIEKGKLKQTMLQDGDLRIDTGELLRAYGRLHNPDAPPRKSARAGSGDKAKITLLEERIRSLERIIGLEAELRRAKDQVSESLRARLAERDRQLAMLEDKLRKLELERQLQAVGSLDLPPAPKEADTHAGVAARIGKWWRRLGRRGA